MYIMLVSRPDLAYPVGKLSQFSSKPSKTHWTSVKRIFLYQVAIGSIMYIMLLNAFSAT
jgi:hypothetical protein